MSELLLRVFTHPACSGCTQAVQHAWKLTQRHPEVELRTVSLEKKEGLSEAHAESVKTIPTLILTSGDSEMRRWVGVPESGALESGLAELRISA